MNSGTAVEIPQIYTLCLGCYYSSVGSQLALRLAFIGVLAVTRLETKAQGLGMTF